MLRRQRVLLVAAMGLLALGVGVSCLWYRARPSAPVTAPAEQPNVNPSTQAAAQPATPQPKVTPPATPAPPPRPADRPVVGAPVLDAGAPQCTRDLDCKGPRQADCTRATCRDGKCGYDYSACECKTAADCDDGDPCTRNHCFGPTRKCIFIKEGCE